MKIYKDRRVIMTLDAGGTNLVFTAIRGGAEIITPITLPSNANDLDLCLHNIVHGFKLVEEAIPEKAVAISFAFPGPSDYKNGVIGDLTNFPSFRDGIALGPYLEDVFNLPVFIHNDGDLFTYGEYIAGFLPYVNAELKKKKNKREYRNLIGITLGTGFGCGIVINGQLISGDNSASGEIWLTRNFSNPKTFSEEGVSIRALTRSYFAETGEQFTPKELFNIATGRKTGNKAIAQQAFERFALVLAESLSNAFTLIDGLVVIGGGITGASQLILPKVVDYMNGNIEDDNGKKYPRVLSKIYNAEDQPFDRYFFKNDDNYVKVPYSKKLALYQSEKKSAIGLSKLGTSRAVTLGAYALGLEKLDHLNSSKFDGLFLNSD